MSWINLGKKIKEYRKLNNLTQQEFANKLGISRSTLSYYENGEVEPNIYTLLKLSEIMNCSIDYLFSIDDIDNTDVKINYSSYINDNEKAINTPKNNYIDELKKLLKKVERTFIELEQSKKRTDLMYDELKRTKNRLFKIDDLSKKLDYIEILLEKNSNDKEESSDVYYDSDFSMCESKIAEDTPPYNPK